MWKVRCTVQGGVTGYRTAYLKDKDGNEKTFATKAEAEQEADQCYKALTHIGPARFSYKPEEV